MIRGVLIAIFVLVFSRVFSNEQVIRQSSCHDALITHQADSIKKMMTAQGFAVVREASMAMESEYEMAILLPLNERSLYQFVFIGDYTSRVYEVRMYDSEDRQVMYQKKMWGDVDGNVISFPFVPTANDFFAIRPVQVNKKKKNLCGYVMLLKKVR